MTNDEIPEAGNEHDHDAGDGGGAGALPVPPLVIGDPFAISYGAQFKDASDRLGAGTCAPGCVLVVQCEGDQGRPCGQLFKINLLEAGHKTCPKCGQSFSHMVLLAPADDDEIIRDAMVTVLQANGFAYQLEDAPGDDDDDDGQADDDGAPDGA